MKNLLLSFLFVTLTTTEMLANDCKVWQPKQIKIKEAVIDPDDWNWSCGIDGSLSGSVFNSTGHAITKIIITGTTSKKSLGETTYYFPTNTSERFYFLPDNGICGTDNQASLRVEYTVEQQGFCKVKLTDSEMAVKRQKNLEQRKRRMERERVETEQRLLYDNCVVAKSKGLDRTAVSSVRRVCREISKNPTTWQKFKWGS